MSVLVADRRQSKAEYVNIARELLEHTLHQAKKFPKSITFYVTQDYVMYIRNCYVYVSTANGIYLNKENYDLRKQYLQKAYTSLLQFESLLSILFNSYYTCQTSYSWKHTGELLSKEKTLIKAVIDADTKKVAN